MNRQTKTSLVLVIGFLCSYFSSHSQKKLLVLGSSTSSCYWGPSTYDSCYLMRLQRYYRDIGSPIIIDNRAVAGDNCYHGMPVGYVAPPGRNAPRPDSNITAGLKGNPDVVLVNYPSNGYDYFSADEVMFCLRTIKQTANNNGKPCYITTSQPRNDPEAYSTPAVRKRMAEIKTRVLAEFGEYAINFWDDIVNPVDTTILSIYNADGTHLNNRGHRLLFDKVVEKNIFSRTGPDTVPPSIPLNLKVTDNGRNSVQLGWESARDNVGVKGYEIYVNNVKKYTTAGTTFTVENLSSGMPYLFGVKAFDEAGNTSGISNLVSMLTAPQPGLAYRYYEGNWNSLPDFDTLTPVKTGASPNIDLSARNRNDYFGFVWEGYIHIPVSGTYTFDIVSDDGSRLYLNALYSGQAKPLIDNDGLHSEQRSTASISLTAGIYPIAMSFFDKTGLENMQVYWAGPGISRQLIPNTAFTGELTTLPGLNYRYYEGKWDALPDFSLLAPVKTGYTANLDLNVINRTDSFGIVWEGYLRVPTAGSYTFELLSDDGSKLYLNSPYTPAAKALIENDNLHADRIVSATVYLAPGIYPFAATFFENAGLENMKLYWTGPGITRQLIPDSAFSRNLPLLPPPMPPVSAASKPTTLSLSGSGANDGVVRLANVFPNPFLNRVRLRFYNAALQNKVSVQLYDLNGKLLITRNYGHLPAGYQTLELPVNSSLQLKPGTYVLKLRINDAASESWKIIKSTD